MTELWLIRHGQTDWNKAGRYQGQTDTPLNALGLEQAEQTARQVAESGRAFAALYSSDLLRARQTAEAIARRLALPVMIDPRLREINQGAWEGKIYLEVVRDFAHAAADPENGRAPGGESVVEVHQRVSRAAAEIAARHPGETVLIVSHGLALATLLCSARGIPLKEVYAHIPNNARPEVLRYTAV